jgi:SAM-dependent methyltransferase
VRTSGRASGDSRGADLARYYDLDLLSDPGDLPLHVRLAAESRGPILELAVGSGRIAVPLAAAGHEVTGVDNDAAMLDRARAKWTGSTRPGRGGSLTLMERDLLTLDLQERFDLVVLALNSLLLLDGRAAQGRALETMGRHLAPQGRAVIDVWLPTQDDLTLYDGREVLEWVRTDPETDERVAKTTRAEYNPATGTALLTTTFDAERDGEPATPTTRADSIHFIGADELLTLVSDAGLQPDVVAGDYGLSPWSEASERVVLICRPKAA